MAITKCVSPMSDPAMRKLFQDLAMSQFYRPIEAKQKIKPGNVDLFRDTVRDAIGDQPIVYVEFGVASGASMRSMLSRFTHPEARFYGFDSFDGLPEHWTPLPTVDWPKGSFSSPPPDLSDARVTLVKGWFQDSLPPFLSLGLVGGPRPHLIHYDADLYSSTLFLLSTLWHHLPEYYFIMDEFMYDEIVALRDFVLSYPVVVDFMAECGDKLFGRLQRVPFVL